MASGDYIVRRNASNTDTIPNAGSDLLLLWDTAVDNTGSGIVYSSGTFTLGETGNFLVLCSDQEGTTDTTNNERINTKMTLTLAGSELLEGYSTGYIRKANGSQEFIQFSAAVINVASTTGTGDELQVRKERIDNTVTAGRESSRIADRSGVTIIKLDDDFNYGRYQGATFTTSTTDNAETVADLSTTNQQDTPFTRTGNVVDVNTTNLVLAIYSLKSEDATPAGRAEYQSYLTQNGTSIPGSWNQTYIRVTDNTDWGGMSAACLIEPTAGDDIDLRVVSRDLGGEDFQAALQLVELPSTAKAIIVQATTGNFNTSATDFAWDTNPYIDTDTFTHTLGNANIDVDSADDYLVFASQATTVRATATRAVPALGFRVNTTDIETAGSSTYNRNSGTTGWAAIATGTLLTGLSTNDSIFARDDRIGTNSTAIVCGAGGMSAIQLSSLFSSSTPVDVITNLETLTLSENQASVALDVNVNTAVETLALTTNQTDVSLSIDVLASTESLSLTTFAASVAIDVNIDANTESLSLLTIQASISIDSNIAANTELLTLTTYPVSFPGDANIITNPFSLTLSTLAATIQTGEPSSPKGAGITWTNIKEEKQLDDDEAIMLVIESFLEQRGLT